MTEWPKVAGKSREGPIRSPRGKFPIYSSPLPNTWEPIKRMNGIVAVAAMLRAALGVHEIRARRPRPLSLFLSLASTRSLLFSSALLFLRLSLSLSLSPFGLSLLLSASLSDSLSLSVRPPMRSLPPLDSSRIETPRCRVASGITMNLHSLASNSEHIAPL